MKLNNIAIASCIAISMTFLSAFAEEDEQKPYGGEGVLAFVNTCDASPACLKVAADTMKNMLMIHTEVKNGSWSLARSKQSLADAKATAAVFVVKEKLLPVTLVAIEEKWGVVNADGIDDTALEKEVIRVASLVMGAAYSKYSASVMRPVFDMSEFAPKGTNVQDVITFDVLLNMDGALPKLGFKPFRMLTKEEAIAEGYIKK